jgi:hypothetical protein
MTTCGGCTAQPERKFFFKYITALFTAGFVLGRTGDGARFYTQALVKQLVLRYTGEWRISDGNTSVEPNQTNLLLLKIANPTVSD